MKKELEFHAGALPGHTNPDDEAERLPLNYLQLMIRYKWRLMAGLIIGFVMGHLLYMKSGPEYEATAEILVKPKFTPPIREDQKMMRAGAMPSEHIKLILSPMIASEAVKLGNLKDLKTFRGEPDLVECVLDGLKAKRIAGQDRSQINVFDLRYVSKEAKDADAVLDAVIAAYGNYLKFSSEEQSLEVHTLAKAATESVYRQLQQKEKDYSDFIQSVPAEFRAALNVSNQQTQAQSNIAPQDIIQRYGDKRNENRIRIAELKSRQKAIEDAVTAGDSKDTIEHQVRRFLNTGENRSGENQNKATEISIYQTQLIPLLLKEKELEPNFGKDWPERKAVRRNLETIVNTYRKLGIQLPEGISEHDIKNPEEIDLVALYMADVKQQLIELQIKEEQLSKLIEEEQNKAKQFSVFQTQEQSLRAEKNSLKEVWTKQIADEAKVEIERESNGFLMSVLSPVKHALVLKRMMKFYAAGAFACLFLVAFTCVLQELADLTIKTVRDVRDIMRQPVLGSVCQYAIPMDQAGPTSGIPHPALRYLHAPSSVEAENYRTIRASLLVTVNNLDAKVIMVSSPEPGDGKTTLVTNLAVALAQSRKRVLLIDGDLRRPSLHRMLRIPQGAGLTEVLTQGVAFHSVIRPTIVEGLSIVSTGTPPPNPGETLSMPSLYDVLEAAREEYDFVLLDAPPMLAVSDPCVMARHTDGILLVARLNKNTRSALIRVRQMLEDQDLPLIGTVVNVVPLKGGHEFGYTYYGEYAKPSSVPNAFAINEPVTVPSRV